MKWAVILAGGNGSRLQHLTRLLSGDDRPKQFCRFLGGNTLLGETRARVARSVDTRRSLCVVTRAHEQYYRRELLDLAPHQLIEQPANRGTAAAIACSLARVASQDEQAVVGFYPADHHYEDADMVRRAVDRTYRAALDRPDVVFLLGTEPETPEVEYGWIEPGAPLRPGDASACGVARFWEKPSHETAVSLLARGCLWNMFVMIGTAGAFRTLIDASAPELAAAFDPIAAAGRWDAAAIERAYSSIAPVDFSRDILAHQTRQIAVMRVPRVGWTDLGQPARVHSFLTAHGSSLDALCAAS